MEEHTPHIVLRKANLGWQQSMVTEANALNANHTWDFLSLPPRKNVVGCRWVYIVKVSSDGKINRLKACFGAQGFLEIPNLDYRETNC
ncbi:Retrovirus-related Pol polyprotein from transposon TNT 1-94 [Gossypium australe]|uniref:Retrovirus-related Pol polyprotein from transposon TNT 1-94 n=1 Tax=Gossypium australe TaxID=47621 RepID=A0A5B6UUR3_9ROSI|nr:Retrovirus-related Pol polyprotein from transposon TNT 1-94 [Gossypium australe]